MNIVCLDMEGVLVPEIWIAFSEASDIPELSRTTRDEPDYDKLMRFRLDVLKEHGLGLTEIQEVIATIDPLDGAREFLDELRTELDEIKALKTDRTRIARATAFQDKLASLTFLDPACGSGNFLTETYISLRRMENEVLLLKQKDGMIALDMGDVIRVSIGQFYGIEINDYAVSVAKTALWIAESQMMRATEEIVQMDLDFLPLKSYANIIEGNALRMDWESVVPKEKLNYIMGNPPFVGARLMSKEQKDDLLSVFGDKWKNAGNLDYVFEMIIPWTSIEILGGDGYEWKHADGEVINALLCVLDREEDGTISNAYQITKTGAVTFLPEDYPLELHLSTYVAPSLEVEEPAADEPATDAPAAENVPTTADAGFVAAAAVMAVAAGIVLSKKH